MKVSVRLADERWEAKERYIESPKKEDTEVSAQRKKSSGFDEVKQDASTAVGGEMRRSESKSKQGVRTAVDTQIPEGKADPWKKDKERGKWEPEAWSPKR